MKRLVLVLTTFLIFFMAGQAFAGDNLNTAASRIESGISNTLDDLGDTLSCVAKKTGKIGLDREAKIRKLLRKNCNDRPYVIDSTFIDSKGVMKFIEPEQYRRYEGSDISKQEAVIRMLKTKQPRMGNVFLSVEGINAIDIEYPVFSKQNEFLGSVSILVNQVEMIRAVAETIEKDLGVKCWVMQMDGLFIYETDPTQMGLNLFTDPLYKDYPELIALGKRMIKEKDGEGFYTFLIHGTDKIVKKRAVWKTIHFFNNDWIVAVYNEVK